MIEIGLQTKRREHQTAHKLVERTLLIVLSFFEQAVARMPELGIRYYLARFLNSDFAFIAHRIAVFLPPMSPYPEV